MNKLIMIIIVMMMALVSCTRIPNGYAGIRINMMERDNEKSIRKLGVGMYMNLPLVEFYKFPTYRQTTKFDDISFALKGGLLVSINLQVETAFMDEKIVELFKRYRSGETEIVKNVILRKLVESLQIYGINYDVDYITEKGLEGLISNVREYMITQLEPAGIQLYQVILTSPPVYPEQVNNAIRSKIEAQQIAIQKQNELATARAKAEILLTEARAESEANRLKQQALTPMLLEKMKIEKWDGKLPTVQGNGQPIIKIE